MSGTRRKPKIALRKGWASAVLRIDAGHKAEGVVSVAVVELCMLRKHMIVV